jgi:hypothetical protein
MLSVFRIRVHGSCVRRQFHPTGFTYVYRSLVVRPAPVPLVTAHTIFGSGWISEVFGTYVASVTRYSVRASGLRCRDRRRVEGTT